ncbi:uncharacterized protein LOC135942898 [Cloeon dipterum]|uniref:uncharacterized protein LOC135942898 n=1 Tax=Cloeon dipterum TaxID=197152 RepID=UPI00321F6712
MKRASKRASDCSMPSNFNRASCNEDYSQLIAAPIKRRSCSPAIKIETPTMLPHHSQSNTEPAQRTEADSDSENVTVKNESYEILPCKVLLDSGDIRRYLLEHSITLEDLFIRSGIELNPLSAHQNKPLKHITIKTEPDDCTDEITNFNQRYLDDQCANKGHKRREVNRTVSFVNITVPAATDASVHDPSQSTSASFDFSKYLKIELLDSAKEPIASDFEEDEIPSLECAERIISSPELETTASGSSDDNLEYESDKCPSHDGSRVVDFRSLEKKKAVTNTRTQSVKTKQELEFVFRKKNTSEKGAGKHEYNVQPRNSGITSCTEDSTTETASDTCYSYSDSERDDFIIDLERDDEEASTSIASCLQERKDEATQIPSEVPKVGDNRTPTAFYCVPCAVKFGNSEQLKSHVLNFHRECLETTAAVPAVKQGIIMVKYVTGVCCYYECPNCFGLFENLKIVSEHLVTVHITEVRKLRRVTCNRVPVKTVKMGPKVPTTGLFHCGYCQRNYTLFEHLRLHMKIDHDILDCQKCLCFYRMSKMNSCPVCPRVTRINKSRLLNVVAGGEPYVKPNSVESGNELIHTMGSFSVKSSTRNNDLEEVLGIRRTLRKPFPENDKGMWTEDDAVAKELKNAPLQQRELVLPDEQTVLVEEEESADGEEDEYSVEALNRLLKSINQKYKSDNNDFEPRESNPRTTRKSPQPRMMLQSSSDENLNGTSDTQQNTDKVLCKMKNATGASPIVDKIPPLKNKSVLESSVSPSFRAADPRIRVKPSIVKSSEIASVQASSFILKTAVIDDASSHSDIRPSSSKGQVMATTSHGGKVATLKRVSTQALQLKTGVFSNVEDLDQKELARLTDIQSRLQMKRTYKFSSSYLPCIFCDKITDKLEDLVGHLVMKHVYCPQCRENFQSLDHFDNHKQLKFYRCSAFGCEQTFRTVTQYAKHDKLVHDCEYVISSEGAKEHEFEMNWEEDSFPCCYCYEYFVCRSVRDQHLLVEHGVAKCITCHNYVSNRSRCQVCLKINKLKN